MTVFRTRHPRGAPGRTYKLRSHVSAGFAVIALTSHLWWFGRVWWRYRERAQVFFVRTENTVVSYIW